MRLISYSEWLNDTLYFQDPIHPDCLQQSYPISSESLHPEDTGQFFKSAQDFPWRCDYRSPWNKDQSYLKFGTGTARHLTLLYVSGSPVSHSPAHDPQQSRVPDSHLTSYSKFLLGWSHLALPHSKHPLHWCLFPGQATGSLWRASPREDPVDLSQCHLEVLDSGLEQPRRQHLILQNFSSATSAIFGNGCHLLLPANGKE